MISVSHNTYTQPRGAAVSHVCAGELSIATSHLEKILDASERYKYALDGCLSMLRQTLRTESLLVASQTDVGIRMINILSLQELQQAPDAAELLRRIVDNMRTLASASLYKPCTKSFHGYSLPVHNSYIAECLSSEYSVNQFSRLFEELDARGVFSIDVHPVSGLMQTSSATENWNMSGRQWITDTI